MVELENLGDGGFGAVAFRAFGGGYWDSAIAWEDISASARQRWIAAAGAVIVESARRQAANGYVLVHRDSLAAVGLREQPIGLENTPHGFPHEPVVSFGDGLVRPSLQTQSPSALHDKYDDPNYARRCIQCKHTKVHNRNQFQVCADCFPRWAATHAKEIAAIGGVMQ